MRVYIGTFDEKDAENVVRDMREAGIKTELRPFLDIQLKGRYFIKGKPNELKEKYSGTELEKIVTEWEKYMEKARKVMKEGIDEKEFEENFLDMIFSEEERKIKKEIDSILKEEKDIETRIKLLNETIKGMDEEKKNEFASQFMRELQIMNQVHEMLSLNGIKYEKGKMYGEISENPLLLLNIDIDGEKAKTLNLEFTFDIQVDKGVSIYGNLMDIIYENKRLEELTDKTSKYIELTILSDVVSMIMEKINGRMDIERFMEEVREMEEKNHRIRLTNAAIEEIIKTLEKMDVIKIRKGKIWLKEGK